MPFDDCDPEFIEVFCPLKRKENNRQKLLLIISKNDNLLDVFLVFREYCISYWFKLLSKIEDNVPFSDYYYEFYFGNLTFVDLCFENLNY